MYGKFVVGVVVIYFIYYAYNFFIDLQKANKVVKKDEGEEVDISSSLKNYKPKDASRINEEDKTVMVENKMSNKTSEHLNENSDDSTKAGGMGNKITLETNESREVIETAVSSCFGANEFKSLFNSPDRIGLFASVQRVTAI